MSSPHDRKTNPAKCLDTKPAFPGDPAFPYAGECGKDLTFAQVRTLDCGNVTIQSFDWAP